MKARLDHLGGMRFRATTEDGHEIEMDADKEHAASPVQATLMAAMGCTAADVVDILRKARQPLDELRVRAEAERATELPRVFTKIHVHFDLAGRGLRDAAVRRAIKLSTEKYCSVGIVLRRGGVRWTTSYEIRRSR